MSIFARWVAVGLGLGTGLGVAGVLSFVGYQVAQDWFTDARNQARVQATVTIQAQQREASAAAMATSQVVQAAISEATRTATRCDDPAFVIITANLADAATIVGTMKNTCNVPVSFTLQILAISESGNSVGQAVVYNERGNYGIILKEREERTFRSWVSPSVDERKVKSLRTVMSPVNIAKFPFEM